MGWDAYGEGYITFKRADVPKMVKALETDVAGGPLVVHPLVPGQEEGYLIDVWQELVHIVPTLNYDFLVGTDHNDPDAVYVRLQHSGKWNDDVDWLKTIAPFIVPTEVCIEMQGEDNSRWGYAFDGHELHEIYPEIVWPKVLEEPQVTI